MKPIIWTSSLAFFLVSCSSGPAPAPGTRADAIAGKIRENQRWTSPEDRTTDLQFLAANGAKAHVDALILLIEKEDKLIAGRAIATTTSLLDPSHLPLVERLITSGDATVCMRGLFLLTQAQLRAGGDLLTRHAKKLLDPARMAVPGVALGAMGACTSHAATTDILEYFNDSEDAAALRALGRIWSVPNPALEGHRTLALLLTSKLTLGAAASVDSALAMMRIMSGAEFDKFLKDFAGEKIFGRRFVVDAATIPELGKERGCRVHVAFLTNPDPALVASILWTSPHDIPIASLIALLGDQREAADGARVCDYAAQRVALRVEGTPMALPKKAERDAVIQKWLEWNRK